ncbi:MAG: hypothetical protein JNL58_31345 [Planctomyces sp.]|nr:hypothetical protein [Planctomyces sp.]
MNGVGGELGQTKVMTVLVQHVALETDGSKDGTVLQDSGRELKRHRQFEFIVYQFTTAAMTIQAESNEIYDQNQARNNLQC